LYLLEPLLALLALQCLLSRGLGKGFVAPMFLGFVAAGFVTSCGYLVADLAAASEPWQYLKGWGRVALLIVDSAALMVLVAHGRQNLWWLALGVGLGGVASLTIDSVPITQWKLGYGEYVAILMVTLAPLLPAFLPGLLILAFGVGCVLIDYRSLGAVCLLIAAILLWRSGAKSGKPFHIQLRFMVAALLALTAVTGLLVLTQEQYSERRQESNIGRYVGIVVAWQAIKESPLIGYGSWAADEKFARMLRNEAAVSGGKLALPLDLGRSLLPHSQFLQAWIEGGLFGLVFFVFYAWYMVRVLLWIVWLESFDPLAPLFLFLLVGGLWNLLASPFLGVMRIYIAFAVGVIAIAARDRQNVATTGLMRAR